jgi:ribosome biogenesis GTPase
VLVVHKGRVEIQNEGQVMAARLDKRLGVGANTIAVGDEVEVTRRAEHFFVTEVYPRRTAIRRSDPHRPGRGRVIAANIDVAVIVVTGKHPPFKPGLVDRWLVVTRAGGVRPVLCVNKIDLLDTEDERHELDRRLRVYRDLDVHCLTTSALSLEGVDLLRNEIVGSTCVFIGHSGVGKSTLLNALDPEASERRSGDVREIDGRGRHTTSSSSLVAWPDGTRVIDTPGVRSVGLFRVDDRQLGCAFPELDLAAALCRFKSCRHLDEPGCRVREAVAEGIISPARYDGYVRILRSLKEEE